MLSINEHHTFSVLDGIPVTIYPMAGEQYNVPAVEEKRADIGTHEASKKRQAG